MKFFLAAALIALAGTARAELVDMGYYDGWNLMVDQDLGNGCLIQTGRDGETLTRIGYDGLKKQGYLAVFNPDWKRLRQGESYPLTFDLDGTSYPAVATGLEVGKVRGAGVVFGQMTVFDQLARAKMLTVFDAQGKPVFQLDLSGSAQALEAARKCQAGTL